MHMLNWIHHVCLGLFHNLLNCIIWWNRSNFLKLWILWTARNRACLVWCSKLTKMTHIVCSIYKISFLTITKKILLPVGLEPNIFLILCDPLSTFSEFVVGLSSQKQSMFSLISMKTTKTGNDSLTEIQFNITLPVTGLEKKFYR